MSDETNESGPEIPVDEAKAKAALEKHKEREKLFGKPEGEEASGADVPVDEAKAKKALKEAEARDKLFGKPEAGSSD